MDVEQLRQLRPELQTFLDRYRPLFGKDGNQNNAEQFLQGLLAGGQRRNIENIAEAMDGAPVRTLQKFISQGCWDDREIISELRRHLVHAFGNEDAVINIDETGFPKKGTKSVGVKRQYSGTLGRVENCQIGVFANYWSSVGHAIMDRRLYLPEDWASDAPRREEAGVPSGVVFRTKPELGLEMIQEAVLAETPFRWVGGDCVYGDNPTFVQGVRSLNKYYVLDIKSDTHVWTSQPTLRLGKSRGQSHQRPKAVEPSQPLTQVIANIPSTAWQRITVAPGSQGARVYEYVELRVWFSEEGRPAAAPERLLIRRSLSQDPDIKLQRSNAPDDIPLEKVAQVGGTRWSIEQDFQAGKGECGLDEYETRGWIGWHHHTVLSILALFFWHYNGIG